MSLPSLIPLSANDDDGEPDPKRPKSQRKEDFGHVPLISKLVAKYYGNYMRAAKDKVIIEHRGENEHDLGDEDREILEDDLKQTESDELKRKNHINELLESLEPLRYATTLSENDKRQKRNIEQQLYDLEAPFRKYLKDKGLI